MTPPKTKQPTAEPPTDAPAAWVPIDDLIPWDKNPRKNEHAVPEAMASLRRFGFCAPIVAWTSRRQIVAGHARMKAMRRILAEDPQLDGRGGADDELADKNRTLRESLSGPDVRHLPVRMREFKSHQEAAAYALRDNNSIGDWDAEMLGNVARELHEGGVELAGLGWTGEELTKILNIDDAAANAGEKLPTEGEVSDTSRSLPAIVFGKWRLPLTHEEAQLLERRIKSYSETHGTTHGLAGRMVDGI